MAQDDHIIWQEGTEWPAELLPQPAMSLTVSAREVLHLAEMHAVMSKNALAGGDREAGMLHEARSVFLRQRVAEVAPYLLLPHVKGNA
jgi:hypothetical protein